MAKDIFPLGDPNLDKSRKEFLSPSGYPEDGGIEAVARWQDLEIMKGEATKNQKDAASKGRAFAFERRKRLPYLLSKGLQKPGSVSYEVLRRAANSVHVVRICINVLKEQVTKTKWAIQSKDPLKKVDQKKMDKIEEFFRHPNGSNETLRTLLDKMVEDLLVLDSVTLEKTRYPDGSLAEIFYVDAASVRPVIDDHGSQDIEIPVTDADGKTNTVPVSYVQVVDSNPYGGRESGTVVALWPKKDFISFNMHPQGSMAYFGYGLSPIEGVLGVVANILNADNYNGSYFEEASFPPMIVHLKGSMGQRELASLRTYLYNELEGKYYRPAIVSGEGEMEVHDLKNDNRRDMQFMEYMKFMATLLSAAYGLSPQDIGLLEDTNRSTSETMKDLSQAKGYGSILSLLEEVFNQEIVWKEFGDKEIEFKFVATDTTDPQITSQIHDTYLKAGAMTLNEVREKIGESPYGKWADVPMVLTGTGYAPIIAPDPAEASTDENGEKKEEGDEKKSGEDDEEDPKEKKGADKKPEPAKKTLSSYFNKSVFSEDGKYEIFFDDRGVSQPFICYNVITRDGYVVKPPVAVALDSESIEETWSQRLSKEGLNVVPVVRISEVDIVNKILETDEIKAEFFKYQNLLNPYDSKKWRQRNGGSRRFETYLVSKFVDGRNLKDNLLLEDMRRVPKEYTKAIEDLAKIWKAEKKFTLGDRRADQVIITKDKRAMTFDYQFVGNENRWKSTKDSYANALISIPYLHDLFLELSGQKTITEKVRKFFSKKD